MCGIVGYINFAVNTDAKAVLPGKLDNFFSHSLICDSVRGLHSTGILAVQNNGEARTYKKALNAIDFLELPVTKSLMTPFNKYLVGHNRWATSGSITDINAHPFTHENITLFHNGTLQGHASLNKGPKTFSVDSDALCYYLANSEDKASALEEVKGAYSLVWYDAKDDSLNFARNEERPMFMAYIGGNTQAVFASEKGMLVWLAEKHKFDLETLFEIDEGKLFTFKKGSKPSYRKFNPKKTTTFYSGYSKGSWSDYDYDDYPRGKQISSTVKTGGVTTITKKEERLPVATVKTDRADEYPFRELPYIVIKTEKWEQYHNQQSSNPDHIYGFCYGKVNDQIINISGVTKAVSEKIVGKNIKVKVYNKGINNQHYGSLIEITDEKTYSETQESEDAEVLDLLANSEKKSLQLSGA